MAGWPGDEGLGARFEGDGERDSDARRTLGKVVARDGPSATGTSAAGAPRRTSGDDGPRGGGLTVGPLSGSRGPRGFAPTHPQESRAHAARAQRRGRAGSLSVRHGSAHRQVPPAPPRAPRAGRRGPLYPRRTARLPRRRSRARGRPRGGPEGRRGRGQGRAPDIPPPRAPPGRSAPPRRRHRRPPPDRPPPAGARPGRGRGRGGDRGVLEVRGRRGAREEGLLLRGVRVHQVPAAAPPPPPLHCRGPYPRPSGPPPTHTGPRGGDPPPPPPDAAGR